MRVTEAALFRVPDFAYLAVLDLPVIRLAAVVEFGGTVQSSALWSKYATTPPTANATIKTT